MRTEMETAMMDESLTFAQAMAEMAETNVAKAILSRYGEPWRRYHDMLHLTELKSHLLAAETEGLRITDGAAALAFVLWHDSVYDPQAAPGRNEALSAQLCDFEFGSIGHPTSVKRACEAILCTIGHQPPDPDRCPDGLLLLDCDLAILGSDPERFALYDASIREEYSFVPEATYREKRRGVLMRFLERDRIFLTDWGWERWEAKARANLKAVV